ncbi:MFS transporter [Microbispora sp. ATCC PTA-5024]|uniref:MFS transporter n=1 Tax=Microbispora sp. ATCC PTA-5024 TaxID=316330 RepID=UPI0003DB86D6|nr:MFS transporter [Microbispora sp. ATCC PTA-5024]ETK30998.1 MFS transporter [Microbispora sp. ATCC PTA-5024]
MDRLGSDRRAMWALVALATAAFAYVTAELLPVGLLTVMAADLDRSPSETGLLVTGYAVVVVLASLPLTRLTRRVPRRRLLTVTLAVFAAGALLSAVAPSYPVLLGGRMLIALTQALFWSVVATTATDLFPPALRGRVVARLAIGNSLAPVIGVPAGTWLGQQAGWRTSFAVMAAVGLAVCLTVALLLPADRVRSHEAGRGTEPDGRRYAILVVATLIAVTGFLTAYTYITPFLLEVGGFAPAALSPLLLAGGISGVTGTLAVGPFLDRHPRGTLLVPLGMVTCALAALYALGGVKPAAVVGLCVMSIGFSAMVTSMQNRTLHVAPGSTDLASAGISSGFNVGIATGSLLGGAVLDGAGARDLAATGAVLTAAALVVLLSERWLAPAGRRAAPEPAAAAEAPVAGPCR